MAATQADLLARHAAASPEKTAVVEDRPDGGVITHTFAELDRRAGRIADLLCELGAVDTTRVAWCGPNSAGLLAVIGGIRRVGAVAVPLNYHLTPAEARYVLDNSDVEVVCVDAEHTDLVERVLPDTPRVRAVVTFDDDAPRVRVVRPGPALAHTDGFRGGDIFYTSGTTGRPKGVVRPPAPDPGRSPLAVLIGYRPDDVYLTTGPLYHSGPARFAAMAQALGNTVVVQRKFHAEDWLRLVDRYGVTATFSAPTPLRRVCGLPEATKGRYDRSRMRRFVANAAPWSQALKRAYLADFPADSLWEVYGSAEFGVAAVLPPADQLRKPGSCGLPAPGVDVALFTDDGHEVTVPHQRGELFVRSPSMFHTYYKAAEQYEIDRRGEYHSVGDVAYRDGDGYLYIADRKKDIIISGGVNIYPAEVEAALDQSPDIYEVAVFGVPDEHWGESVHAAVVPARPGVTVAEVIDFARAHLAGYKLPRTVTFLGELPKTGSGKVLKRALRARLGGDGDPC